jgi:hypothetical protein
MLPRARPPLTALIAFLRTPRGLIMSLIVAIAAHATIVITIPDHHESLVGRRLMRMTGHPHYPIVILNRPLGSTTTPTILIPDEDSWDSVTPTLDANTAAPGSTVSIRLHRIRDALPGLFAPWATRTGAILWKAELSSGEPFTPVELALIRDSQRPLQQRLDALYAPGSITVPSAPGTHTTLTFRRLSFTLDLIAIITTLAALIALAGIPSWASHRARRLAKNLCPTCGYNAQGLAICPECGTRTNHPAAT